MDIDVTINTDVTMRDAVPADGARHFRAGDEILGRYVVESELGQGGMGVVYLCLDKVGGVKVAVKGLPPEVSHNSDEMEEVRRNFQLVCALRHPGIAGIRTLEREESTGLYYLVMDVAEGQNLTRWMREHAEPGLTPEKLTILRDIASALDYAHERRILHRDIKPGNIMVGPDGRAQVLDFGLAAQIRSSMSRMSLMVTSQSGTPAYKSPEQWKGRPQRAAADQYSLAVIAYKMISGELPFDGDDLTMLGRAVMNETPEKVAGVPAPINAALQKALAKEPGDRYESCTAFVAALGGTRSCASAGKTRFAAALLVVLSLAAAGGWWWHERVKSEELRVRNEALAAERARQKELDARRLEERAEALAFQLAVKAGGVHERISKESDEVKDLFKSEIRAFEDDRMAGETAKSAARNVVATNFFVMALDKASALLRDIGKKHVKSAESAAIALRAEADKVNAKAEFPDQYAAAERKLEEARGFCASEDYDRSCVAYEKAQRDFCLVRTNVIEGCVNKARAFAKAGQWDECLALANKVIGWIPDHQEMLKLRKDGSDELEKLRDKRGRELYEQSKNSRRMDRQLSFRQLKEAAELGNVDAQCEIGSLYWGGYYGVDKNVEKCLSWYRTAAGRGSLTAQFRLGLIYEGGQGVEVDKSEALKWFQMTLETARRGAERGDVKAQRMLGIMYYAGKGVLGDEKEAMKWDLKAAEQGDTAAMQSVAFMYGTSSIIPENKSEMIKWYRKAADLGDPDAQLWMCTRYSLGDGVEKDAAEARKWRERAEGVWRSRAENGDMRAQCALGIHYESGTTCEWGKDLGEALKWYRMAAQNGHEYAQKRLREMGESW